MKTNINNINNNINNNNKFIIVPNNNFLIRDKWVWNQIKIKITSHRPNRILILNNITSNSNNSSNICNRNSHFKMNILIKMMRKRFLNLKSKLKKDFKNQLPIKFMYSQKKLMVKLEFFYKKFIHFIKFYRFFWWRWSFGIRRIGWIHVRFWKSQILWSSFIKYTKTQKREKNCSQKHS